MFQVSRDRHQVTQPNHRDRRCSNTLWPIRAQARSETNSRDLREIHRQVTASSSSCVLIRKSGSRDNRQPPARVILTKKAHSIPHSNNCTNSYINPEQLFRQQHCQAGRISRSSVSKKCTRRTNLELAMDNCDELQLNHAHVCRKAAFRFIASDDSGT